MRKVIFIPLVLAVLSLSAIQSTKVEHSENYSDGFHFFRTIHLDNHAILTGKNKVVQPLMLSKDHDYSFNLEDVELGVEVIIRNNNGDILASNYDKKTKTYYRNLGFQAHISEFYNIEIKSQEVQKDGLCVIYCKDHIDDRN